MYCRLFEEVDQDGNKYISPSDLRGLLLETKFTETSIDKEKEIAEVMKEFDLDGDQKINEDEFVNGFTKWLDETKHVVDKQYFSKSSLKDVYKVIHLIYTQRHNLSYFFFIPFTICQH